MIHSKDDIKKAIRKTYQDIAVSETGCGCCCDASSLCALSQASVELGYSQADLKSIPTEANMGLGCGNPIAGAEIKQGEIVLDLGSGGGIDCFLAAQKTGEKGRVIGVDMTPEMIEKARGAIQKTEFKNVEFRLGEIEHLPVADQSIDVVISNCVINLSLDKPQVMAEIFRVLKPGGRAAISDIVAQKPLSKELINDLSAYGRCISGAVAITEYEQLLKQAGFIQISITPIESSKQYVKQWLKEADENYIVSASILALKAG